MTELHGPGIAADLLPLATPLTDLYQMPGNPRRGDVEAVKRSYAEFGQVKPIVCQRDGMIVAGNHQFMAARALGWSEIAVVRVDLTAEEAAALNLADNRTSELGSYDPSELLAMIGQVQESGNADLVAAISYSDEAIAELRKALDGDPMPSAGDASTEDGIMPVYGVIVECMDEAEQIALLREMSEAGRKVRALIA